MKKRQNGFSLVELLIVIAIISVLATVAYASFGSARESARDAERIAEVTKIAEALEFYYVNNREYPPIISVSDRSDWSSTIETYLDYLSDVPTAPNNGGADGDMNCNNCDRYYLSVHPNLAGYRVGAYLADENHPRATGSNPQGTFFTIEKNCDNTNEIAWCHN